MITALIIFVIVYSLISVRGIERLKINRTRAALLGAAAMIIFGVVAPTMAFDAINYDVIFLLLGMMALVVGLEYCGLFEIISDWLLSNFAPGPKLLGAVMVLNAFMAAIVLNDAVVLLFTPIIIRCCASMKIDPVPYLVGTMLSANIGSVATAIGNPHNAYIVSESGITFMQFIVHQLPVTLVCLPAAYIMLLLFFRKRLTAFVITDIRENERVTVDKGRLLFLLTVTGVTFVGFAISGPLGIMMCVPAMIAGAISIIVILTKDNERLKWTFQRIDWGILLFFIGLFIIMKGVEVSGILGAIAELIPGFGHGETPTLASTAGFVAIISNLVSNMPSVILIFNLIPQTEAFWYTLAASSTLAGNATLLGSACNIIVAEKAAAEGIKINFWKFMLVGIPITVVTILLQLGVHSIIF